MADLANVVTSIDHDLSSQLRPEHVEEETTSVFNFSDKKISDLIYETHKHNRVSYDEDSLFNIVQNILKRATQITEKLVQGSNAHVENIMEFAPNPNFRVPLCEIKSIGSELSCKRPSEKAALETTLSILHKLSSYKWEAKPVLALAAFAYDFGDLWHFASLFKSDPLATEFAYLKNVPQLIETIKIQSHLHDVQDFSKLVKKTTEVIAIFDEFEKLKPRLKDIPALPGVLQHIPVDVFWTIFTIAALATKISILISDEPDKHYEYLSPYAEKINKIHSKLTQSLKICKQQRAEFEIIIRIEAAFATIPTEVLEIFKLLIFPQDITEQFLIVGPTNKREEIDKLKKKYLFLFFSTLDINAEEIRRLNDVYERAKKENEKYEFVWIPIVEKWNVESENKYEELRSKIHWYIVPPSSRPIAGTRFIKEKWQFKGKAQLVVINSQGKVENTNALLLINNSGLKYFPYDKETIQKPKSNWLSSIFEDIDNDFHSILIEEQNYIFFYGGEDENFIKEFHEKVTILQKEADLKYKITIRIKDVRKTTQGGEDRGNESWFWDCIQGLFLTMFQTQDEVDRVHKHIQTLLSYKNDNAWAFLTKGSTVITAGHGSAFLEVIKDFEKWKNNMREKDFKKAFNDYYFKVTNETHKYCSHLEVPVAAGTVLPIVQCSECDHTMETFVIYKCCHPNRKKNIGPKRQI